MIHGVDHIGIAVKSIEASKKFWVDTLGLKFSHVEEVPEQKVRVAILSAGKAFITSPTLKRRTSIAAETQIGEPWSIVPAVAT